jgi:AraC-like DNA-binding protein
VAGCLRGWVSKAVILEYTGRYEWLVLVSLVGYPLYVKFLLRGRRRAVGKDIGKGRLLGQIANVLLVGVGAGILFTVVRQAGIQMAGADLRMLPYICFSAIPLLILRHRLQRPGAGVRAGGLEVSEGLKPDVRERMVIAEQPVVEQGIVVAEGAVVVQEAVVAERRYEKSGLDGAKLDEYAATLMAYMEKSRIYLDSDLSLDELASRLKMSRHHLTQLLNDRLMKNFYSFINEYRIGVAIARLDDPEAEVNILSLAFDCGFNSRSSFNNYFKKITGCTPSAYRKRQVIRAVSS